ncbi:GlxA family transcriptional regulator [Roseomonas fluvialis]|uniref:AraC family transcriptional regulator n=1 Tax=Roseomonas fluvialis TaxID=1750527 RepID=A0ABN6P7H0_9PROT|nr:GlxA family transcriptional regulator [Roseomonas fluvialis]BDG74355.1 AraC family transcriptional regulator [Roseomonas fluvialis]
MRRVALIIDDGFQPMVLAALTAFEFANRELGPKGYAVSVHSERGGPVRTSLGMTLETAPLGAMPDTLLVAGLIAPPQPAAPAVIAYIQSAAAQARRVAALCTGAFVLAQSGVLEGRAATTHWAHARHLQQLHPGIHVDDDRIFIKEGNIWTSAGMSAAIDLSLALIEEDHGAALARTVARRLVVYHRRPGGQSQYSALLDLEPRSDRVMRALTYARENLRNPLTVEELADAASLSPRQFSRVFRDETGRSPAKAVELLRLEAARAMMEDGRHPLDIVAREAGFADRDRMRRAFLRTFGRSPASLKRSPQGEEASNAA